MVGAGQKNHPRNTTKVANVRLSGAEAAPYRSPRTGANLRRAIRVGTWNIRSLSKTERLPLLSLKLKKVWIAIPALSEVWRPGSGENGYTVLAATMVTASKGLL